MRGFHILRSIRRRLSMLETAFDEAWLTLKAVGNSTVRPDELARSVLRLAMEGERDPCACTMARSRVCCRRRRGGRRTKAAVAASSASGMGDQHRDAGEGRSGQRADERRLYERNRLA